MTSVFMSTGFTVFHSFGKDLKQFRQYELSRGFFIYSMLSFLYMGGQIPLPDNRPAYLVYRYLDTALAGADRDTVMKYRCFFYISRESSSSLPGNSRPGYIRSTAEDLSCGSSQLFISGRLCHLSNPVPHPPEYSRPDTPSSPPFSTRVL